VGDQGVTKSPARHPRVLRAAGLVGLKWTRGTATQDADGQKLRSTVPQATARRLFAQKGTSGRLVRQPDNSRQRAPQSQATGEGAGGTSAPPAGPSGVCAAPAARPGASRDSVQAVVLPGRHRRPVTSPMTQLDECPSLSPWRTYHDEPSCLTARPVEPHPRTTVKALARLLAGRPTLLIRGARDRHARAPRAAGSRRAWSGSRLLRDRSRHEY
jgi:hypothetical protein